MTTNGSVMISTSTNNLLLTWLFGAPYFGIPDVQGIVARGSQTNNSSLSFTYWSGKLTANHGWSVHASDLHEFVIDVSCHQCPHAHSCPVCEDWICSIDLSYWSWRVMRFGEYPGRCVVFAGFYSFGPWLGWPHAAWKKLGLKVRGKYVYLDFPFWHPCERIS